MRNKKLYYISDAIVIFEGNKIVISPKETLLSDEEIIPFERNNVT